jgi:hypothetical protein
VQDRHDDHGGEFGMKPGSTEPLALQQQHDTDDPRHDHRRHHYKIKQPALHRPESFRQFGAGFRGCVVHKQSGQIEHSCHPRDDGDDVQSLEPEIHDLLPAQAPEHALDMSNRCFRQDAVAEIENQGTGTKFPHDIIHLTVKRCAASQ